MHACMQRREVVFVGGGVGLGLESVITDKATGEALTQLTVGPLTGEAAREAASEAASEAGTLVAVPNSCA